MASNKIWNLNHRLAADLGRVATGEGLYKWIWSEDPVLLHPMRVPGEYNFVANPESGLINAEPVYKLRKMCLVAENQWVLCHWIEAPSEGEWRKHFGYSLEWPRNGQYYPTTVSLDKGTEPNLALTQTVITEVRIHRMVSPQEVARRGEEMLDKKLVKKKAELYDRIRDDCPTYDHVPGTKDILSYPSWGKKENNADNHSE